MVEIQIFDLGFDGPSNKYRGFTGPPHLLDVVPRPPVDFKKVRRVAKKWNPPKLEVHNGDPADFTCINAAIPVFSKRAIEALRDILECNGEILPINTRHGEFYVYNTTTLTDVLDIENSHIIWHRHSGNVLAIDRYKFYSDRLNELSIFRVPLTRNAIYVTTRFVECCTNHKLRGFNFRLLWPLPPTVHWLKLAKEERLKKPRWVNSRAK